MAKLNAQALIKRVLLVAPVNRAVVAVARKLPMSPRVARVPVRADEVVARVGDVELVMLEPERCIVAKELFWGRGQRVRADARAALALFTELARWNDVVLDVGANTGLYAIAAALANPTARVHAFEIVPDVYELLVRNVVRNDLADRIETHLRGVGDPAFTMRVPSFRDASSLPTSVCALDYYPDGAKVRFTSLDDELATCTGSARALVKIDVEGSESEIFRHGRASLERVRPDIVCEILPGTDIGGVVPRTLGELGYATYRIEGDALSLGPLEASAELHAFWFTARPPSEARHIAHVAGLRVRTSA